MQAQTPIENVNVPLYKNSRKKETSSFLNQNRTRKFSYMQSFFSFFLHFSESKLLFLRCEIYVADICPFSLPSFSDILQGVQDTHNNMPYIPDLVTGHSNHHQTSPEHDVMPNIVVNNSVRAIKPHLVAVRSGQSCEENTSGVFITARPKLTHNYCQRGFVLLRLQGISSLSSGLDFLALIIQGSSTSTLWLLHIIMSGQQRPSKNSLLS